MLLLRLVQPEDASELHRACWPDRPLNAVEQWLADVMAQHERGLRWGLVALVNGEVVGYGQITRWGRSGEISDLAVAEGWQGQGIGTAIIRELLEIARQNHVQEIEIGAAESNPRAAALYERLGFRLKRRVMLCLDDGPEPVLFLSMKLEQADGE